ncbi:MAG: hypothetical protein H6555_03925 [Lewinellaceae bacterium]|nr:hypothetical protein [Lewinellaceae bacterium]
MRNIFFILTMVLLPLVATAGNGLKRYEFAELGLSIPFFEDAIVSKAKNQQSSEYLLYSYEQKAGDGRIIGTMHYYKDWGCMRADTFYNIMERYAANYDGSKFRPLTQKSTTMYLGWTFYDATLTVDKVKENVIRKVQAFFNGEQCLLVDVIFINEDFAVIGNEIFDEPGYQSILRPLRLPKINLTLLVRGHVTAAYSEGEKAYVIGRCDKLGSSYPCVMLEKVQGDPAMNALGELASARALLGFDNVTLQTVEPSAKLAQFPGGIQKVIADETGETSGRGIYYFFMLGGESYKVSLLVPYGPDDNRLFFKEDRQISQATADEMDIRVLELLGNMKRI